jgi:molybdopterin-synthase adenylyltransferase
MNDDQLLRYSRHILLTEIGIEGQERLLAARALIVGAGGLGSPVSMYLAAAGVGEIVLCDADNVDLTNLQRQIVHRVQSIGLKKVESARDTLAALNPGVSVTTVPERVAGDRLNELVSQADVVLDASDNFATRHAINRACVKFAKPLVSGAAVRFDGQVAVFDLRRTEAPCYACLFSESGETEDVPCSIMGVFAPLTGIVGTLQAAEAIKIMAAAGTTLNGRVMLIDALSPEIRTIRLSRDPSCAVCANR